MVHRLFKIILSSLLILVSGKVISDTGTHGHNGILTPYHGEPPEIELSSKEISRLMSGRSIFKKFLAGKTKRGIAIFMVHAPADVIWSVIKDFQYYPEWIEDIKETQV